MHDLIVITNCRIDAESKGDFGSLIKNDMGNGYGKTSKEEDEDQKCLLIHQKYILKILEKYGVTKTKTLLTPADPKTK